MTSVWLTYAWQDNADLDLDYIAQELQRAGIVVKLDRWNIGAGRRLWEQIDNFITNPSESDAWILYATQNSLGSEACKEEYAYALTRALHQRGAVFPLIVLFPSTVDESLLPAGLRIRLNVSAIDPDWKERIKSAAEGRTPNINHSILQPYSIEVRRDGSGYVIEVRPRAGSWSPFFAAIPITEKDRIGAHILHGPRGHIPHAGILVGAGSGPSNDGAWFLFYAQNEATPTQSYFIFCTELPSAIAFGVMNGGPQFTVPVQIGISSAKT
jgi:hypothetical protein